MYFNFSLFLAILVLILNGQVHSLPANEKPTQNVPPPPGNDTTDGKFKGF